MRKSSWRANCLVDVCLCIGVYVCMTWCWGLSDGRLAAGRWPQPADNKKVASSIAREKEWGSHFANSRLRSNSRGEKSRQSSEVPTVPIRYRSMASATFAVILIEPNRPGPPLPARLKFALVLYGTGTLCFRAADAFSQDFSLAARCSLIATYAWCV